MSYDVSIWCVEPFSDAADLPDPEDWEVGDHGWTLAGAGWVLHSGASEMVLEEDIPKEIRPTLPGIHHVVHLSLGPGDAPRAGRAALRKAAKRVAEIARGVFFDPQADTIELPSGARRYVAPAVSEARIPVLAMSWWLGHGDLVERPYLERLLDVLSTHVPEVLPRRYGTADPPQYELARTGRDHFVGFLLENLARTVVWYAQPPLYHVSLALRPTCGFTRSGARSAYRSNHLRIEIDQAVLDQPGWATALLRLWRAASRELRPFFGDVRSLGGHLRKAHRVFSDVHTDPHPIRSWWWNGIPPRLGHAAVVGEPYLSEWPALLGRATSDGLAFIDTPDWREPHDAADLVGGVPAALALPFMAHWTADDTGGWAVTFPEGYPPVFPVAQQTL